jgi:hypothetical protein
MIAVACVLLLVQEIDGPAHRLYPDAPAKLTEANCQMLRRGMSRLEVAAIVGGRGELIDGRRMRLHGPNAEAWSYLGLWKGTEVRLSAWFGADGKLTDAFYELRPGGELRVIPKLHEKP